MTGSSPAHQIRVTLSRPWAFAHVCFCRLIEIVWLVYIPGTERLLGMAPEINVNLRLQDEAHIFGTEHIPVQDTCTLPLPAGPECQPQPPALPGPVLGLDDEPSLLDKPSDALASDRTSGEVEAIQLDVGSPPPPPVDYFQRQFKNAILVAGLKHITDNCLQDTLGQMRL